MNEFFWNVSNLFNFLAIHSRSLDLWVLKLIFNQFFTDIFINGTLLKFKRTKVIGENTYKFIPYWIREEESDSIITFEVFLENIGWAKKFVKTFTIFIKLFYSIIIIGHMKIFSRISLISWKMEQTLPNITLSVLQPVAKLMKTIPIHLNSFSWNQKVS